MLTVRAQDASGNIGTDTLTVTYAVSVTDTSPPTVQLSSPTPSSTYSTTGSTLTLRGTSTDNVGVTQVTWTNSRGGAGTASGTTNWTANVTGLQSGTNLLTVRARDAAGNTGSTSLTVTYTQPLVCDGGTSEIYRVNGGSPLHSNGTLIKGRNDPTVYLIQNGQKRGIPSQSILNNLYQQPNGGFENKDVITVAADELVRYATGAVINSSLPSNGRSQPDGRLIQRVGGSEISIVSGGNRLPFASESTFLGLGYLYCNVVPASDYDSYTVGVLVDAITTLRISSVTPSTQQTRDWGGSITYTFTVVDGNGTPVSGAAVGGQDNLRGIGVFLATSSTDGGGQGTYTTTVPTGASNGIYDITFLTDKTGYIRGDAVTRQVEVNHFQDSSPPSVTITSPTTNSIYNANVNTITLAGTASDDVGVSQVTWTNDRGGSGTSTGTSNWTGSGIVLQAGSNVLDVTARDSAGNIGTATLTVLFTPSPTDTISPTVAISSPTTASNYETPTSAITLAGTASDDSGVTQVSWINDRGGSGTASGTTNWTANAISLQVGFNVLTVIAQDNSGNIGTAIIIVNYTTTPSLVQFGNANYSVSEEAGIATITVNRLGDTSGTATVNFATSDGTAKQSRDYTLTSGTLTFAAGETSKSFPILVTDNAYVDGNRTVSIALSNPTGGVSLANPITALLTILDNDTLPPTTNPLDNADAQFFVRQQYYDFLNREPDPEGLAYWANQITECGTNTACVNARRIRVSNAFFFELEFQQTGAYVYRLYREAFGNNQPFPNTDTSNLTESKKFPGYSVFVRDRARVVGGSSLPQAQLDLANLFVQRPEFLAKYPAGLNGPDFVDAVLATIKNDLGVDLTSQRTALIDLFNQGGRGAVIYRLADDNAQMNPINNRAFIDAEYNRAFVTTQYFGYLRRDADIDGLVFWLGQVNRFPLRDVEIQNAMVCSFVTSIEYQQRFSPVVTHSNAECPQ